MSFSGTGSLWWHKGCGLSSDSRSFVNWASLAGLCVSLSISDTYSSCRPGQNIDLSQRQPPNSKLEWAHDPLSPYTWFFRRYLVHCGGGVLPVAPLASQSGFIAVTNTMTKSNFEEEKIYFILQFIIQSLRESQDRESQAGS